VDIDFLKDTDRNKTHLKVKGHEGLSEDQETSLNRGLGFFDKSVLSQAKKAIIYTLGFSVCVLILFIFTEGIYLSCKYLKGLLDGTPNKALGDFLSTVLIAALSSLSTLFLQGLFQKK
jgi:hypothetical protein